MTSSNGNIFRVTGPLCREFTGHWWFPLMKCQWHRALMFCLICIWINGWVNNHEAGDLRRHRFHYDVIVMNMAENSIIITATLYDSHVVLDHWQFDSCSRGFPTQRGSNIEVSFMSWHDIACTLRWRHNGLDSVSNHQPPGCLLNRLFRRKSKKTSKLRVTGLCAGNSPGTGEFSAQMASYAENVSIWWRHHDKTMPVGLWTHNKMSHNLPSRWSYRVLIVIFWGKLNHGILAIYMFAICFQSHFTGEGFTSRCGCTPRECRALFRPWR